MKTCPHCNYSCDDQDSKCPECSQILPPPSPKAAAVREARDLIGETVAEKYEILDLLGEGGMGIVYKARHLILNNRNLFALKVLHPRFSGDPHLRDRFIREVEVAMDLAHENIVQIREFGFMADGTPFFTMDYVEGTTLKALIKREAPFEWRRVVAIVQQLLQALAEAHRAKIVHRDLKPENVLVSSHNGEERVRILDFGIAKLLEADDCKTMTQVGSLGTPRYMSPEQAAGEDLDSRSDLYSLGVLVYELLTGKAPFYSGTTRNILMAHLTATPPPLRDLCPDVEVPASLEKFVFQLLNKRSGDRPATAEDCMALLDGDRHRTTRATDLSINVLQRRGLEKRAVALVLGTLVIGSALGFFVLSERFKTASAKSDGAVPAAIGREAFPGSQEPDEASVEEPTRSEASQAVLYTCQVCSERFSSEEANRLEFLHHALPLTSED